MLAQSLKSGTPSRIVLIIATLLTTLVYMPLAQVAQAQRSNSAAASPGTKVSVLLGKNTHRTDETINVIVTLNQPRTGLLNAFLKQNGVQLRREFKNLSGFSVSLPYSKIAALASFPEISHISTNEAVLTLGHVSSATGADAGRAAASAAGRGSIDGSGVGIAILDSGISADHAQFAPATSRILVSVDLTGENRTDDPFGHGTFVAAAAAGGAGAGADYTGIAPGASLLNVRVLDSAGNGTVETVLAGLDWVAAHARQYNIRIVNMSLGMRAVESYKYDPLCRAIRGLVNSGIVVFVAAGNEGKAASGDKIYGSIHSPGIEPSAFTIGASNTFQTDARQDDEITTFSSRGPTRSYWTDTAGQRY